MATTKNTFRAYGMVNRAVTTFERTYKEGNSKAHELFVETAYHGLTTGDFSMANTVLRLVAESDKKFMVNGFKLVAGENAVTFKDWIDGNGNACFIAINKSKKAIRYTNDEAEKIALSIPFFKDLETAFKAEQKANREKVKLDKAEAKAAQALQDAADTAKQELAEIDASIELHGVNEPVSVYTDVWDLTGKITDLLNNGKITLTERNFAESFVAWFAENDILKTEEKKTGTNG